MMILTIMNSISFKNIGNILSILVPLTIGGTGSALLSSCSDWSDHYDEASVSTTSVDVVGSDIATYVRSAGDLSQISSLFAEAGIFDVTTADKQFTFIVCDNETFAHGNSTITDKALFAKYCVSDVVVTPSELKEGFGINNRAGKTIWIYGSGDNLKVDEYAIKKTVKTANGYVYYIDGVLPVRQSAYEYLKTLGSEYSHFRALVEKYESRVFDREHSTEVSVNNAGQVVYDSVWVMRHSLLDRYTSTGVDFWNMRGEQYTTTMFIPDNQQLDKAINDALDSIPLWLNRKATKADRKKFEEWVVRACFSDQRLDPEKVKVGAADVTGVGGYTMHFDSLTDVTSYKEATKTLWRPSVQTVNADNRIKLSNGYAYYTTSFKIPNHIVIHRLKTRLYQVWDALDATKQNEYFSWTNLGLFATNISTLSTNDALYKYGWPVIEYNLLSACPTDQAIDDSLTVAAEYSGLIYDEASGQAMPVTLPAGEYYLRMGFERSTTYSIRIYFNDNLVWTGRADVMNADRYASDIPDYGTMATGYPEKFNNDSTEFIVYDPQEWMEYDQNASAYDTDGYTVGIVNLKKSGNFRIRVESDDMAYRTVARSATAGDGTNKFQMFMYHWCLRPTPNNY